MKKRNVFFFSAGLIALGLLALRPSFPFKNQASSNGPAPASAHSPVKESPASSANSNSISKANSGPGSSAEKKALDSMSQTLYQFTRPDSRLADLIQYLDGSRQNPQIARNSNPHTGDMVIVRTRSPLSGTRYFHAQYFADENNKSFIQHISFEYKPSPTAFQEAIQSLKKAFPHLPDPKVQTPDFTQWSLDDGYVLWVKRMKSDELQDDPFNAYSPDDVGTVRVAMELEIHGQDEKNHR